MRDLDYDVIVVGAGFSGATSARDLADRGLRTLVLEATDRIGGRGYARPFKGHEDVLIECGGAWVNPDLHPQVAVEIARYGVELTDERDATATQNAFFTAGQLRGLPVSPANWSYLEAVIVHLHDAARRFSVGYPAYKQPVSDLDISAREFFAPLGLPQEVEDIVYAVFGAFTGTHPDRASVLHAISKIAAYGYRPFGSLLGGTIGIGHQLQFKHGTSELPRRMLADSRVEVRLSTPVQGIRQGDGHVEVRTATGTELSAAACIVAVPGNAIKGIEFSPGLGSEKAEVVAGDHRGRSIKSFMIVEGVDGLPSCTGRSTLVKVLPLQALSDGRAVLVGYAAAEMEPLDPLDRDQVEAALRRYLPEARVVACAGHDWNNDPFFRGAYQVDAPGRSLVVPRVMSRPEGRIVFSGADLDEGIWRVSFESAVRTGHAAASKAAVIASAP